MPGYDQTLATNRALVKIGGNRISNPTEVSEQARVSNLVFKSVAQAELRRHAWSFAMARASLAATATPPAWGYPYAYNLPADFIRFFQLGDYFIDPTFRELSTAPTDYYAIEGLQVLTYHAPPLKIRYVADKSLDLGTWDATFFEAFACRLAYELEPTLLKRDARIKKLQGDYATAIVDAKRCNAIERPPQVLPDSSWMISRYW